MERCWKCKHLQKSIYMVLDDDETLYNCWCNIGNCEKEECDKFEVIEKNNITGGLL